MPEFDMEVLAKNLRVERANLKLSQEEVANNAGIKQVALSNWENGSNVPNTDSLFKLAKFYGKSIDELCGFSTAKVQA